MNKFDLFAFISLLVLLTLTIFTFSNSSNDTTDPPSKEPPEANTDENEDRIYWGVDSASYTDENFYMCVNDHFGEPAVWGRYLAEIEGVSHALDAEEVARLHEKGIDILVIYNKISDARGYDHGVEHAEKAIVMAEALNVPEDVAIFGDIEPNFKTDAEFLNGWYDTFSESPYIPAIYGVFNKDGNIHDVFLNAKEEAQNELILWTAYPQEGITTENDAPEFNPQGPENANLFGWQYGLDAETCNIDTNLFTNDMMEVLWKTE